MKSTSGRRRPVPRQDRNHLDVQGRPQPEGHEVLRLAGRPRRRRSQKSGGLAETC
jgi:hypothetical protein